jgi:hypothetical protein
MTTHHSNWNWDLQGDDNPPVDGVAAPIGTTYRSTVDGSFWIKFGLGDFDWRSFGGAATQYAFVYQPGGVAHDNVYTDWPTLITAMSAISGPKLLQFDNSFNSILIPTGTWSVDDVTWVGRERQNTGFSTSIEVQFDDAAVVTGLRRIRNLTLTATTSTAAPISDFTAGDIFYIEDASTISGGNPVLDFSGTGFDKSASIVLVDESQILQGGTSPIKMGGNGTLNIYVEKWSLLEPNTVDDGGIGTSTLQIFEDGQNNISVVQSFFSGNVRKSADLDSFNLTINQAPLELDTGTVNQYPFGFDKTINLPQPSWHPGGWLVVKNNYPAGISGFASPTNALVLDPGGGNTIDNRPTYTLAAGAGSIILASDGVSNWEIIGAYGGQTTSDTSASGSTPGAAPGESVELGGPLTPRFQLTDNQSYTIVVTAVAKGLVAGNPNVQSFKRTFAVRKTAGLTTIAATGALEQIGDAASASWTLTASVAAAPDRFALTFNTGATTSAVNVTATCEITEVA